MRKSLGLILFVVLSLWATTAFADGFYFSTGGGAVVKQNAESNGKIISEELSEEYAKDLGPPIVETFLDTFVTDRLKKKIDFSTGFAGYAAVGKRINKYFRVELEYAYKNTNADEVEKTLTETSDLEFTVVTSYDTGPPTIVVTTEQYEDVRITTFDLDADVGIHTIMLNGFFDYDNESIITPFVGGGLGTAFINFKGADIEESDNTFAWQLIGGASVKLTDALSAQAFYRYLEIPSANLDGYSFDIDTHSVEFGVLYTF